MGSCLTTFPIPIPRLRSIPRPRPRPRPVLEAGERDQSHKCLRTEFEHQHPHKQPGAGGERHTLIVSILGGAEAGGSKALLVNQSSKSTPGQ